MSAAVRSLKPILSGVAFILAIGPVTPPALAQTSVRENPIPVNVHNFIRAESDLYFS